MKKTMKSASMASKYGVGDGKAFPLGATYDGEGVNFAIFSDNAETIELCLFTSDTKTECERYQLTEKSGNIWHIYLRGMQPGTQYGYRVHGPYDPENGYRFNANKLLIDPYAKKLSGPLKWSDAVMGYHVGSTLEDLSFDTRDSALFVPKSVVIELPRMIHSNKPDVKDADRIVYEAHVKGMTKLNTAVPEALRGTYLGMSSPANLEHLTKLGITSIELLPVQSFITDSHLEKLDLTNYWGYQSIGFFAPEPRYMMTDEILEFQMMVEQFHTAGIEVILDVVYNHTGEGNEFGPTLSFRGIDNASYYRLSKNSRHYQNDAGTGNMLDLTHPQVLRMVMDSLRYWVEIMHVDGFRFDLATVLAREETGFDLQGGFLDAINQDPVLKNVKLIAEPWDLGPGGYQMGNWPHPFMEWNDQYRDDIRKFWRGDHGMTPSLAKRVLGSSDSFDHDGRKSHSSVNFISAHDGYTLADTTRYVEKHNWANKEGNKDGHNHNCSDNFGVEGETEDPHVNLLRLKRARNLLTTLIFSQGTPMILAGDEFGNSQGGNNNAYAQDNEIGWLDWPNADLSLLEFTTKLISLRKSLSALRQDRFLHGILRDSYGQPNIIWHMPDGKVPDDDDWENPEWKSLGLEIRDTTTNSTDVVFIVFNASGDTNFKLPNSLSDGVWTKHICTYDADLVDQVVNEEWISVIGQSIMLLSHREKT